MDHYPEVKRPFLDRRALSSPLDHESESESSEVSGSDTPSPSVRPSARSPSFTPPHEENASSERSSGVELESSKGWYEFDLSVILALVSPIGNWLTGGDHVKNILLILLLIFYLHQIIEGKCFVFILKQKHKYTQYRGASIISQDPGVVPLMYHPVKRLSRIPIMKLPRQSYANSNFSICSSLSCRRYSESQSFVLSSYLWQVRRLYHGSVPPSLFLPPVCDLGNTR
jgi:hypothetical protein